MSTKFESIVTPLVDPAPLGRIGVLLLPTDMGTEQELSLLLPAGVRAYHSRVCPQNQGACDLNREYLLGIGDNMKMAAQSLLPGYKVDVMVYNCTSGAVVLGPSNVQKLIRSARPDISHVTDPFTATTQALHTLGSRRILVLTPYIDSINQQMVIDYKNKLPDIDIVKLISFGLKDDEKISSVPLNRIKSALLDQADFLKENTIDTVFISCTGFIVVNLIAELEKTLNVNVITSTQAVAWYCMQLMDKKGIRGNSEKFGRLFDCDGNC